MNTESRTSELGYLLSAAAVRETAGRMLAWVNADHSQHFSVNFERMPAVLDFVSRVTEEAYPDLTKIPYHSRLRHFAAGGIDRLAALAARLGSDQDEARRGYIDLVTTSVLLDAGAGPSWRYYEQSSGQEFARSEGLALASLSWFSAGGFASSDASSALRADAEKLEQTSETELARAFQVGPDNPLVGLAGRVELLRRLGAACSEQPEYFAGRVARPGNLGDYLAKHARSGTLDASLVLDAVLRSMGGIWPGRETLYGTPLGDVWRHSSLGLVPLHKLSQWLTYSLCECLERTGIAVQGLEGLTGLAEYRNGGLFVELGVIVPKHDAVLSRSHEVNSDLIIEWRALTVALLDQVALELRGRWHKSEAELPLVKILEGGTWAAGRRLAFERDPSGAPPIRVESDGTVF